MIGIFDLLFRQPAKESESCSPSLPEQDDLKQEDMCDDTDI